MTGSQMSNPNKDRGHKTADGWYARHESGDALTARELESRDCWIADPRNSAEYAQLARIRWTLDELPRPPLPSLAQTAADSPTRGTGSLPGLLPRRGRWLTVACAATCAVAIVGTLALRNLLVPSSFAIDSGQAYTTGVAEQRQFTLADGSVVTLAASSSLSVTLSPGRRTIRLDRGEARFRVQRDPWRPFTVFAGGGTITAVGTVFDVRQYSDRVFVSVSEGVVKVQPHETVSAQLSADPDRVNAPHQTDLHIARGQEVNFEAKGDVGPDRPSEEHLSMAGMGDSLVYRDRPLHEVVEDVQRYTRHRIVLDMMARDLLYTGTFVEQDLEQWLRGLSKIFPVEVIHSRTNVIVIRSKAPPQLDAANDTGHQIGTQHMQIVGLDRL
jgi:transmembrane sensor